MTTQGTQDDFLVQILDAEKKASDLVEKAQSKAQSDLQDALKKGEDAKIKKVAAAREKAREKVKDAQAEARKSYESDIAEGVREAKLLEKGFESKLEKLIPQAQNYLTSDLLVA